jgi:hypothetical protein
MVLSKTLILILFINLVKSNSVPGPCPEEEQFFLNRRKFVIKIKTPLCQSNDVLEKSGSQTTKKAIACDVDDCYDKNNNSRTVKIVISADAPTKCEEEAPQDQGNDAQENSVLQPIKKTKACNVNARYDKNHDTPGLKKDFLPADAREGQNKTKGLLNVIDIVNPVLDLNLVSLFFGTHLCNYNICIILGTNFFLLAKLHISDICKKRVAINFLLYCFP